MLSCFLQKKAKNLVAYYNTLIPDDKAVFLKTLASQYSVDHSVVLHLAKSLEAAHVSNFVNIKHQSGPSYINGFLSTEWVDLVLEDMNSAHSRSEKGGLGGGREGGGVDTTNLN